MMIKNEKSDKVIKEQSDDQSNRQGLEEKTSGRVPKSLGCIRAG